MGARLTTTLIAGAVVTLNVRGHVSIKEKALSAHCEDEHDNVAARAGHSLAVSEAIDVVLNQVDPHGNVDIVPSLVDMGEANPSYTALATEVDALSAELEVAKLQQAQLKEHITRLEVDLQEKKDEFEKAREPAGDAKAKLELEILKKLSKKAKEEKEGEKEIDDDTFYVEGDLAVCLCTVVSPSKSESCTVNSTLVSIHKGSEAKDFIAPMKEQRDFTYPTFLKPLLLVNRTVVTCDPELGESDSEFRAKFDEDDAESLENYQWATDLFFPRLLWFLVNTRANASQLDVIPADSTVCGIQVPGCPKSKD